jgi:hypothetical protein
MLDELKPKYIRIAATWSETEEQDGVFTTEDVDWQMDEASKRNVKVILVVRQKAPRWPECHVPQWTKILDENVYRNKLFNYVRFVVERYKNNKALELWQVENEPFIKFAFGECSHYRDQLVTGEIAFVKELDPVHKTIVTDSGELSTWGKAVHAGDLFGTTLYRVVRTPRGYLWSYDWLPAAFYRIKAGLWGRKLNEMYVVELQAEPWFTDTDPTNTPITEQEKTMNPDRLKNHIEYVQRIGVSRAYLWGVEWWYWMKEKQNDSRYWNIVKGVINKGN